MESSQEPETFNSNCGILVLDISSIFYSKEDLAENITAQLSLNDLVKRVAFAMENVGFMQITTDTISFDYCREISQTQREYFSLSSTEKNKIKMSQEYPYGYECNEILSMSFDENDENKGHGNVSKKRSKLGCTQNDLKETFQVCLSKSNSYCAQTMMPERPVKMGETLMNYYDFMTKLSFKLMELFALALNLPRNFFEDKIDTHQSSLRLLNYPQIETVSSGSHKSSDAIKIRASEHSDYGIFTILMQDEVGGLQIRRSENLKRLSKWEDVKPLKDHFVVNIGDLMMRWTNDKWKSTVHRVVAKEETFRKTRQSVAFFFNANSDAIIETISGCCLTRDNKYDNVLAGEYLMTKHNSAMNRSIVP